MLQPPKCRSSLWNSSQKKHKIWTSLPPIWIVLRSKYAARLPFCEVIPFERFVQMGLQTFKLPFWVMAALDLYYFEPNMLQTPKWVALKMVKWINAWKKICFWPCEGCQVNCRFISFPPISIRMEWRHINTAWLPRQFPNGSRISHFFWNEFL